LINLTIKIIKIFFFNLGSPVVHPVALVLAIGQPQQQPADEVQYLLSELHTKIKTDTTARVCR
jgi:hypothetical protein